MILATVEEIPLMIAWKIFPDDDAVAELMIDDVDTIPFTVEVNVFVADDNTLVVVGRRPTIDVVDITPLTLEVTIPPE